MVEPGVKWILTAVSAVVVLAVSLIDPDADNSGSVDAWRVTGKMHLYRLMFRPGGSLRPWVKPSIVLWLSAMNLIVWLFL